MEDLWSELSNMVLISFKWVETLSRSDLIIIVLYYIHTPIIRILNKLHIFFFTLSKRFYNINTFKALTHEILSRRVNKRCSWFTKHKSKPLSPNLFFFSSSNSKPRIRRIFYCCSSNNS